MTSTPEEHFRSEMDAIASGDIDAILDHFCADCTFTDMTEGRSRTRAELREYLAFIEAGGYREPSLWLSEGWEWRRSNALEMPMYWSRHDGQWQEFTLAGAEPLTLKNLPVSALTSYCASWHDIFWPSWRFSKWTFPRASI